MRPEYRKTRLEKAELTQALTEENSSFVFFEELAHFHEKLKRLKFVSFVYNFLSIERILKIFGIFHAHSQHSTMKFNAKSSH